MAAKGTCIQERGGPKVFGGDCAGSLEESGIGETLVAVGSSEVLGSFAEEMERSQCGFPQMVYQAGAKCDVVLAEG